MNFWRCCLLHGAGLRIGEVPRISMCDIVRNDSADSDTLLDRARAVLTISASMPRMRVDADESGVLRRGKNVISRGSPER